MTNKVAKVYKLLKAKKRFFTLGLVYLFFSLIIGEFHPFSQFPMYNSFPNWSYVFYFSDENDKIIPTKQLHTNTGHLSHIFYTACESIGIDYGNGIESKESLYILGETIAKQVALQVKLSTPKKVKLHRVFLHKENNKIIKKDVLIYEGYIQ